MTQDQADILHLLDDLRKEVTQMRVEMKPIIEAYSGGKWAFTAISLLARFIIVSGGTIAALYGGWLFIKHQITS